MERTRFKAVLLAIAAMGILSACATSSPYENSEPVSVAPDPVPLDNDGLVGDEMAREAQTSLDWKSKYIGISGHFSRPPIFQSAEDQTIYQRCMPIKITGLTKSGDGVVMTIKQGRNTFKITGLNRKPFHLNAKKRLPLINHYFVKRLDLISPAGAPARAVATTDSKKVCEGKFWAQMSKQEFLFLSGDPDVVKKEVSSQGPHERWVYSGSAGAGEATYYFKGDKLYSWAR